MLNNIKTKKISEFLAQHYFKTCLVLALFAIVLGGLLLYKYKISVKSMESYSSEEKYLEFNEKDFRKILDQLGKQEKEFINNNLEIINDPFE